MLRRTLLAVIAGGAAVPLTPPVMGAAEHFRRRMDETLVSTTVSPAMLDHWEEAAAAFGRQYMNTPPMRQLCDVLLEFSTVRQAMENHQPIDLQERLCALAARLSGLAGIIMIDLGDQRLARSFFRTSRTAADETGDRALRAWVTARESLVPLFYGDPREALTLAKKSRDLAGQTPCAAKAMAPVVEARALSMLANSGGKKDVVDQAKRALSRARAAFAQMAPAQQEDTVFGYTERQLYFHQGDALARLGQTIEADLILEQALEKYEGDLLDQTLIRFDRAHCRLLEGDGDEALRLGVDAVTRVGEGFRTDIILRRAHDLVKAIEDRCGDLPGLGPLKDLLTAPPPAATMTPSEADV
ncbi:XRE family transcriptional regulator [Sphaerisporangium sp. TRM90804]|uniref:XRE family transcriptional regulator n=1 Tax=Sphaerisporangium sp. TRM90804 TaxID=3031113 RepID=UPI00244B7344|nr:XRE family transcriptional regulator [Sphaerisporangium sp. TRM90804]MDH2429737.1 XRE family transcriptional regulator [Sphaerisporangium sp. TRM90804]